MEFTDPAEAARAAADAAAAATQRATDSAQRVMELMVLAGQAEDLSAEAEFEAAGDHATDEEEEAADAAAGAAGKAGLALRIAIEESLAAALLAENAVRGVAVAVEDVLANPVAEA